MPKLIDISLRLGPDLPTWPGDAGFQLLPTQRIAAGDAANVSRMTCGLHAGTHIDAPWHFAPGGAAAEDVPLDVMVGPAFVAHLPDISEIAADDLSGLSLPLGVRRLLMRTRNSDWWASGVTEFRRDYVALTADAARWVVKYGVRLIGVDYLSVQRFSDGPIAHQILLDAGVVVLEGLNLARVPPGSYELLCLPLRLVGADGAPARAVLRPLLVPEPDDGK